MKKSWQQHYPKGVPLEIPPIKEQTLAELFDGSCKLYQDKIAFSSMGSNISFKDLSILVNRFALYLQYELNLEPGTKIAIMLPNLLQYPIVMFAALKAGLTIVNINPMEKADALQHELSDSGAQAIIVLENFAAELSKAVKETQLKHIITTNVGDCLGFPQKHIVNFVLRYIKNSIPKHGLKKTLKLDEILFKYENNKELKIAHNDLAFIQYTSGTTSKAKGVMLSHKNILANIYQAKAWLNDYISDEDEIIITALPLYHIFSLTANCWVYFTIGANNILIPNPRDMNSFVKQLKGYKFTAITGVNTLFHGLINNSSFHKLDFSALKITLGGGMAVSESVALKWHSITGCHITQAYGLTETSPAATINLVGTKFNGSIGFPIPSTDICIKDDNGKVLAENEQGEICIKGPQVTSGYWHNTEATKSTIKDNWLHTGDIGYMDKDGLIYIVDRLKDLIVVSGFNVTAIEVENCLIELSAIAEAAVVALNNEHQGESIAAHIVLQNGKHITKQEIINHCHAKIAAYKVPHHIYVHNELPKNNLGKILKRKLRELQQNNTLGEL